MAFGFPSPPIGLGRSPRQRSRRKEVAGPYRGQSSVPAIRAEATPREHRKLPTAPTSLPSRPPIVAPTSARAAVTRLPLRQLNDLLTPSVPAPAKPKDGGGLDALLDIGETVGQAVAGSPGAEFAEKAAKIAREVTKLAALPDSAVRSGDVGGRRTLGKPTVEQLVRAATKDRVRVNKRGKITIPATRKAARRLALLRDRRRSLAGPLPGLDPEQTKVARTVLRRGERASSTSEEDLAALEVGLVESSLRNLPYGDADSEGFRQERRSLYPNPRNVKAAADRLYRELRTDPGTQTAPTPGLKAQAAQGSAFPERYDEREAEAKAILRAYERGGKPGPGLMAKLKAAKAQAQRLGIPTQARQRPGQQTRKTPTIVRLGRIAQRKFGLTASEHPAFGGVEPVHKGGSFHYSGQAIDVSGDAAKLAAFNKFVATRFGDQLAEMFYDPGINIDNGVPTGPIGGHPTHVHVAIDEPGTKAHGLVTQGYGLSSSQPVGYYGSGGTAAAARESAQRAKAAAITPIVAPTSARAALPAAFQRFQLGAGAEPVSDATGELDIIEQILRRRRV